MTVYGNTLSSIIFNISTHTITNSIWVDISIWYALIITTLIDFYISLNTLALNSIEKRWRGTCNWLTNIVNFLVTRIAFTLNSIKKLILPTIYNSALTIDSYVSSSTNTWSPGPCLIQRETSIDALLIGINLLKSTQITLIYVYNAL